jgi:hypothetical protein
MTVAISLSELYTRIVAYSKANGNCRKQDITLKAQLVVNKQMGSEGQTYVRFAEPCGSSW